MLEATHTVKNTLNRVSLLPARPPATDVDDYTQKDSLSDDDSSLLVPEIPTAADPLGIVEAVPTLNKRVTWWWWCYRGLRNHPATFDEDNGDVAVTECRPTLCKPRFNNSRYYFCVIAGKHTQLPIAYV